MKILIIFTFYLISGAVDCSDVIGYSGGSVIMISNVQWNAHESKYICKVKEKECTDIIRADTKCQKVQDGRFMLYSNTAGKFLVLIRKLKSQDAGTYRFGLGDQSNTTANLKVLNNASCGLPKILNPYVGQNITITCKYPGEFERNIKYVDSVNDDSLIKRILRTDTQPQNDRFSISDDKSAKAFTVNISDVREADEEFYLFGVWNEDGSVRYYSFFIEIWLHVTGLSTNIYPTTTTDTYRMTLAALTEPQSVSCFSSSAIISVCVCAALLLIGGFALMIYKLRHMGTKGYKPSSKNKENTQVTSDYNIDSGNVYENCSINSI